MIHLSWLDMLMLTTLDIKLIEGAPWNGSLPRVMSCFMGTKKHNSVAFSIAKAEYVVVAFYYA